METFLAGDQDKDIQPGVADDSFEQIGSTLRQARRAQGLKISDVSQHLRISVDYLSNLEMGAFDQLPAPAYVTGFLRSYGQFVAVDPTTLVARYNDLTTKAATMPTYKIPVGARPPQRSAPAIASMLVVCAGIAYGGWYWINGGDGTDRMAMVLGEVVKPLPLPAAMQDTLIDQDTVSPVPVDGQAQSQDLTAPAKPEKVTAAAAVIPIPSVATDDWAVMTETITPETGPTETGTAKTITAEAPAGAAPAKPVETAVAIDAPSGPAVPLADANGPLLSGDLAEIQVITPASQDGETRVAGNSATANLRDPAQEITIRAVAASWVEIVRDNGEEVMAKLMRVGDSYVVEGNTRLYLSTGNAGGLEIVIGSDDPRPIGGTGQIVRDLPLVIDKLRQAL
ncbi:helix-turn-helix domain-containing protein [Candidatus Ponderosibacter sp. Uisw_141_02]|uniref:helix-turn-helix domain-containing protein n=1 Tax=Candidatus Ponderosibacter sp. Uisw_141_02 TaxID=3231000 RepID=UPI003D3CD426